MRSAGATRSFLAYTHDEAITASPALPYVRAAVAGTDVAGPELAVVGRRVAAAGYPRSSTCHACRAATVASQFCSAEATAPSLSFLPRVGAPQRSRPALRRLEQLTEMLPEDIAAAAVAAVTRILRRTASMPGLMCASATSMRRGAP
jgi:hypothetical protein